MNSKDYRRQWAEGEIEAGTLLDAIDMLSGALEHIAKTCNRSRTSTRRLRWIEQRARWAVEGKPYDRDAFDLPKDAGDTPQKLSLEVCRLKSEIAELKSKPKEHLPLFTCMGKGGEYAKIGYAKPAGALKAIQGDSGVIVYRDIESGQLYFRDPRDFQSRMLELCDLEPCSLGGDILRELTTADRSLDKQ